jgi:hypothetical protein
LWISTSSFCLVWLGRQARKGKGRTLVKWREVGTNFVREERTTASASSMSDWRLLLAAIAWALLGGVRRRKVGQQEVEEGGSSKRVRREGAARG